MTNAAQDDECYIKINIAMEALKTFIWIVY